MITSEQITAAKTEWQTAADEVFGNSIMLYHFHIVDNLDSVTLTLYSQQMDKTAAVKITHEMLLDADPVIQRAMIREMKQKLHKDNQ